MMNIINLKVLRSFTLMICLYLLSSCGKSKYQGYIFDRKTHLPLKEVLVRYDRQQVRSDEKGYFIISNTNHISDNLIFYKKGYRPDTAETINLGVGEGKDERYKNGQDNIFLTPIADDGSPRNKHARSTEAHTGWTISSKEFLKFYKKNLETGQYTLVAPQGFQLAAYSDVVTTVHESPFGYGIKPGEQYLTAAQFNLSGIDCKIIIYNVIGENDSPVLNIQLNSYNREGKLQDAMLLDSRFTFETVYYRDFFIYDTGSVKLKFYEKALYTYNEQGDIMGTIKHPPTNSSMVTYKIQADGKFSKLTP